MNSISVSVMEASFLSTEHLLKNNSSHESSLIFQFRLHYWQNVEVKRPEVKAPVTNVFKKK